MSDTRSSFVRDTVSRDFLIRSRFSDFYMITHDLIFVFRFVVHLRTMTVCFPFASFSIVESIGSDTVPLELT